MMRPMSQATMVFRVLRPVVTERAMIVSPHASRFLADDAHQEDGNDIGQMIA